MNDRHKVKRVCLEHRFHLMFQCFWNFFFLARGAAFVTVVIDNPSCLSCLPVCVEEGNKRKKKVGSLDYQRNE